MATIFQRSFAAGEISPVIQTRVDTVKYAYGLATCRNAFIGRAGGWINRSGTRLVAETQVQPGATSGGQPLLQQNRLIPFETSSTRKNAIIDLSALGGRIIEQGAIKRAPQAGDPFVSEWFGTGLIPAGYAVTYNDKIYIAKVPSRNVPPAPVSNYWEIQDKPFMKLPNPFGAEALPELQYVQNGNTLTIAHQYIYPSDIVFNETTGGYGLGVGRLFPYGPKIEAPTNVSVSPAGAAPGEGFYIVTAISAVDFEESLASAKVIPAPGVVDNSNPRIISWTAVPGAYGYNVYRSFNSRFGLITTTPATSYRDTFISPADYNEIPPEPRTDFLFLPSGNVQAFGFFPGVVGFSQQRLIFANTLEAAETVWASRTGAPRNFTRKFAGKDDESSSFRIFGKKRNAVKHIMEIGKTWIFTEQGEYSCSAITRAGPEDLKLESSNGSGDVSPLAVGASALYIQAGNSLVRDLGFDQANGGLDGFAGGDLTLYASHLFEGHSIKAWAYQQRPDSIVWAVRDDGILLALTYLKDQQIVAWHRHDTDGFVEDVATIPEGPEHAVYLTVRRTINGVEKRFIERMAPRYPQDQRDYCFLDSAVTYDGRNTVAGLTVTLSNGNAWNETERETLKFNNTALGKFTPQDVGKEIHLFSGTETVRLMPDELISDMEITVRPLSAVPVAFRNKPLSTFARATDTVSVPHLEGKKVGAYGDGYVVASPNNPNYASKIVTAGKVSFDAFYSVIHVGLPFVSDLETLDIDSAQAETMMNKALHVGEVNAVVESSRGVWIGTKLPADSSTTGLYEQPVTDPKFNTAPGLMRGKIRAQVNGDYSSNGRACIRQVDPLPLSVLGIAPTGLMPFGSQ